MGTSIPASSSGGGGFGTDALFRADWTNLLGAGVLSNSDYNPLVDSATYNIASGTNKAARDDTYTGGVLTAPHGGNGSALISPVNLVPGTGTFLVANPSTASWGVGAHMAIALTPTGAGMELDVAMTSNVDDIVVMRLLSSISNTVFELICDGTASAGGKVQTACNSVATIGSGITVGSSNFRRFLIGFNATTGILSCGVDGVLAATLTPAADMPTKAMSPMLIFAGLADVVKVHGLWMGWSE